MTPSPARTPEVPLATAAKVLALRLRGAGHEAYFAGGCVRDLLMGLEPKDFDIATSATPEQIAQVYPKARGVGESFGVMLVRESGWMIEVATFREDCAYRDGRRPSEVRFATAQLDVSRRDFTINGLFMDPQSRAVVDYTNGQGQQDLRDKIIRAIGDPVQRIEEDRLRMLRAVRFAARFAFAIEPRTASAIQAHAGDLRAISAERVGEELRALLRHSSRARGAQLLEELGLDAPVLGRGLGAGSLTRLRALPSELPDAFTTALMCWILDRCERGSVLVDATIVPQLRARFMLSNLECSALEAIIHLRERFHLGWQELRVADRCRTIAAFGFGEALEVLRAEAPEFATRVEREAEALLPARVLPKPLVDGDLLISRGLTPGKEFKELLHRAMDAQLEGAIASAKEGLQMLFPT